MPARHCRVQRVWVALDTAATTLGEHYEYSRWRQNVIAANAELQERELTKMAALSAALGDGLRRRGVREPDAILAAEVGIAVLRVAFERWVSGPPSRTLSQTMRESFDQVKTLTAAS